MSLQGQFSMLGPTIRPLTKSDPKLVPLCPTLGAAVRQALIQSGIQQDTMAGWLGVTSGHFSNQLSGKKRLSAEQVRKIVQWTGCDLPMQKLCADAGGQFWFDQHQAAIAAHEAAIRDLKQRVAA